MITNYQILICRHSWPSENKKEWIHYPPCKPDDDNANKDGNNDFLCFLAWFFTWRKEEHLRAGPHHVDNSNNREKCEEVLDDILDSVRYAFTSYDARTTAYVFACSINTSLETVVATTVVKIPCLCKSIETESCSEDEEYEEKCLFHEFYTNIVSDNAL